MRLSIFSFDWIRAFARLPIRRHAWHGALGIGMLAVYLGCVEWIRRVSESEGSHETVRTLAIKALSDKTEVIFLGNSVVEAAIDSSLYPMPVMALPMANGNYEVDELILRSNLPKLSGLKTVVMQLDATCLGWDRLGFTVDYRAFEELGVPIQQAQRPLWWRLRQKWIDSPWVKPMLFGARMTPQEWIWNRKLPPPIPPEPGYSRLKGVLLEADRIRYFTKDIIPVLPPRERVIERNEEAAVRIAEQLQDRGIRLVFLRYPTRGGYKFFASQEWDQIVESFAERIPTLAGGTVKLLDLADDAAFQTSDFRDTIHLNERGAAVLARRLPPLLQSVNPSQAPSHEN